MANLNTMNRFTQNPVNMGISRSMFDLSFNNKTTLNAGQLIPLCTPIEVLPGDTFDVSTAVCLRGSTPIHPVLDDAYLDIYYFYVPMRLLWDHFEEFEGANKTSHWAQPVTYSIPQCTFKSGIVKGSIADYMGLPLLPANNAYTETYNDLPFRGYELICNEYFRNENISDPIQIYTGDVTKPLTADQGNTVDSRSSSSPAYYVTQHGGAPFPVAKIKDYFTSCLPAPQKGNAVLVPLSDVAPVIPLTDSVFTMTSRPDTDLRWVLQSGHTGIGTSNYTLTGSQNRTGFAGSGQSINASIIPDNLFADLSSAMGVTVSALRMAFQTQKLLEQRARGGTRMQEILLSTWKVNAGDARLQRPEYLSGKRLMIQNNQVLQTSSTDTVSPQGNVSAYSMTVDASKSFTKSFVEKGYLYALGCIRTRQTYSFGSAPLWKRKGFYDFYNPIFANISEQPVIQSTIYDDGFVNQNVFGYQEAWTEYRYLPSTLTGDMRPASPQSLDVWHYGSNFASAPTLSNEFIMEGFDNVDRTLAIKHTVSDQFYGDFRFKITAVRPLPQYSIPGLIDHH